MDIFHELVFHYNFHLRFGLLIFEKMKKLKTIRIRSKIPQLKLLKAVEREVK